MKLLVILLLYMFSICVFCFVFVFVCLCWPHPPEISTTTWTKTKQTNLNELNTTLLECLLLFDLFVTHCWQSIPSLHVASNCSGIDCDMISNIKTNYFFFNFFYYLFFVKLNFEFFFNIFVKFFWFVHFFQNKTKNNFNKQN
jgi:hypothetical protein